MTPSQLSAIYDQANGYYAIRNLLPLKIGVIDDIDLPVSRKMLEKFLAVHCNRTKYLQAFQTRTHRYDLDGNRCEPITEDIRRFMLRKRGLKNRDRGMRARAKRQAQGKFSRKDFDRLPMDQRRTRKAAAAQRKAVPIIVKKRRLVCAGASV